MTEKVAIHWFRQDLRLSDNQALTKATEYKTVLPIYILDNKNSGDYALGEASRWWLHYSLKALDSCLDKKLSMYHGDPQIVLNDILERFDVGAICWNRCYEPWRINRDTKIKEKLKKQKIKIHTYNSSLLWEPWEVKKNDGGFYKVFTPFYRKGCLNAGEPTIPLLRPKNTNYISDRKHTGIDGLDLLPRVRWDKQLEPHWEIGEAGAQKKFRSFINKGLSFYKEGRNIPAKPYVSGLSPHIHFGEISPNQLWHTVKSIGDDENIEHFCSELGWREFSHSQLYYNPKLPYKNLQSKFDHFPWIENQDHLSAWQTGNTGIPMIDAGMRQLWQTGYMHNRVRMIVGSFLVKNLRLDWRHGERWFWNTLVDADLANNSASWQWIAGCGADAAPYFRIFNPVTQGQKFDPKGEYIRQYIPEIASLPDKYLFAPWETPELILKEAGIKMGLTYSYPIIDLKESRKSALIAFRSLK